MFVPGKLFKSSTANIVTYYKKLLIRDVKSFVRLAKGANVLKLFGDVIYEFL
jgi:hypothetical protein